MTNPAPPPAPDAPASEAPAPQPASTQGSVPPAPPVAKGQRNVLGIVALVVAAVGFIFACVPVVLIAGWVLLPIGFILGLVSVFLKGTVKWQGITAIIVSVVGAVIGVIVVTLVAATAFGPAFGGSDVEVGATTVTEGADTETEEAEAADVGTRANPLPLGTAFSSDEWIVVVNSVTLNAAEQIAAANPFNEAPDAGTEFILINYTVTYTDADADGGMPAFVGVEYVTADGVTVDSLDKVIVAPDEIDTMSPLHEGASTTGNYVIQVPTPADGVLAIRPGMNADKVFVAIQ